jgi:hypothetical protein
MSDIKNLAYRPSFGGRNVKPEEVISFVSIVEDLFTSRYTEKDKIKAVVVLLKNKARVWFDMLKRDHENGVWVVLTPGSYLRNCFFNNFFQGISTHPCVKACTD